MEEEEVDDDDDEDEVGRRLGRAPEAGCAGGVVGVSGSEEVGEGVSGTEEEEEESEVLVVGGWGGAGGGGAPRWTVMALRRQLSHCCLWKMSLTCSV